MHVKELQHSLLRVAWVATLLLFLETTQLLDGSLGTLPFHGFRRHNCLMLALLLSRELPSKDSCLSALLRQRTSFHLPEAFAAPLHQFLSERLCLTPSENAELSEDGEGEVEESGHEQEFQEDDSNAGSKGPDMEQGYLEDEEEHALQEGHLALELEVTVGPASSVPAPTPKVRTPKPHTDVPELLRGVASIPWSSPFVELEISLKKEAVQFILDKGWSSFIDNRQVLLFAAQDLFCVFEPWWDRLSDDHIRDRLLVHRYCQAFPQHTRQVRLLFDGKVVRERVSEYAKQRPQRNVPDVPYNFYLSSRSVAASPIKDLLLRPSRTSNLPQEEKWCCVIDSSRHGKGVFARTRIPAGTLLFPYLGHFRPWLVLAVDPVMSHYTMALDATDCNFGFLKADHPSFEGTFGRTINSSRSLVTRSKSPNVLFHSSPFHHEIVIEASRDLKEGEELFADYNYGDRLVNVKNWLSMRTTFFKKYKLSIPSDLVEAQQRVRGLKH
eukprot:GILI01003540.1.p1 GENE.GILI01003540.1~~GILI01003540.1.p1  ORF type:complete len:497 (-),score=83.73 GILI01003540.1:137-1627(-)